MLPPRARDVTYLGKAKRKHAQTSTACSAVHTWTPRGTLSEGIHSHSTETHASARFRVSIDAHAKLTERLKCRSAHFRVTERSFRGFPNHLMSASLGVYLCDVLFFFFSSP